MQLNTAAAVISHIADLEKASAEFYEESAARLPRFENLFRALARENRKNAARIRQAYYNSATDALEGGFSFKGLTAEVAVPQPGREAAPLEVLEAALRLEKEIRTFYESGAASSELLLADVSRVMRRLAQSRERRQAEILAAPKT